MEMMLVEGPRIRPYVCVDGSQEGPVVDTLLAAVGGRVYLSPRMVRDAARLYGFVERAEHDTVVSALTLRLDVAAQTIVDLEGEVAELQPVRDALIGAAARFGELEPEDEPVRKAPRTKKAA